MEEKIFIKFRFGDWHQVNRKEAKSFCKWLTERMTCPADKRRAVIEGRHLKGISLDELMED